MYASTACVLLCTLIATHNPCMPLLLVYSVHFDRYLQPVYASTACLLLCTLIATHTPCLPLLLVYCCVP